jgi:hypothetical protein
MRLVFQTQKTIFDREQRRKDSNQRSGKTSRQLRREAAKSKLRPRPT